MRGFILLLILGVLGGCAAEQKGEVMIALVIANQMDRIVVSSNIEFTPESGVHQFGNINAGGGSAGNLGFPVKAKPTAMRVTYYVANQAGIDPMTVDANTETTKVIKDVDLVDPRRNEANYPEFHLVIRPDGSVVQVMDIEEDRRGQQAGAKP